MPTITILAFRGTGFKDPRYKTQPLLLRAGHVVIRFNQEPVFLGFRPTDEAAAEVGDDDAVIAWLKAGKPLRGAIFNDTDIVHDAYALSQQGARTIVWALTIEIEDEQLYAQMRQTMQQWYTDNRETTFTYSFPQNKYPAHNCATFPEKIGLDLPEETGNLQDYIDAMIERGAVRWTPGE